MGTQIFNKWKMMSLTIGPKIKYLIDIKMLNTGTYLLHKNKGAVIYSLFTTT